MEIEINGLSDLPKVAKLLLENLSDKKVWAFEGEMGAGKTTLVLEILKQLGIEDAEGSPTYSLVNGYQDKNGGQVFHFDLFRVEEIEEALDMGIEEMIYDEAFCLIEWPKKVEQLLPEETIWLYLSIKEGTHSRILRYDT